MADLHIFAAKVQTTVELFVIVGPVGTVPKLTGVFVAAIAIQYVLGGIQFYYPVTH